jgi:VWFA-related protein
MMQWDYKMHTKSAWNSVKAILLAGVLSIAALPARTAPGDPQQNQQQQPPQAPAPIRVQASLVNVFATVRDKHNAILSTLTKDDFQITEDGQKQEVSYFARDVSLPITLGLLLDTSGSESARLGNEKDAMSRFMHLVLRKGDLAMFMTFDTDVDLLADFTDDQSILNHSIDHARINATAGQPGPLSQQRNVGTAFYDAVYLACHDQLRDQAGRKALVIVTDAQDNGSRVKLDDAIQAAQRADAVVHIILISDPAYGGGDRGVARRLTEDTGGRVIEVRNERDLEKAFEEISNELRSQYTLGYSPTNAKRDGTFRKIKVETISKDDKVLARKGYFAPQG